jgi:hypothetical protein
MDTYDPSQVNLVLGGQLITGYMDGTFIQVSREEDTWLPITGADGWVARARNANRMGRITVTLLATSPSNDVLSAQHNLDYLTGVPPGAVSLSDNLGRTVLGGDDAFILKPADVEFDKQVSGRQWTIMVPRLDGVIGGAI